MKMWVGAREPIVPIIKENTFPYLISPANIKALKQSQSEQKTSSKKKQYIQNNHYNVHKFALFRCQWGLDLYISQSDTTNVFFKMQKKSFKKHHSRQKEHFTLKQVKSARKVDLKAKSTKVSWIGFDDKKACFVHKSFLLGCFFNI